MVLHKQEEAVDIRCGPHLVLLRTSQGRVLGWGQNKNDCLGESKPVFYRPQLLTHPALHDILSVAAGDGVCMFIRAKQGMDTNQEGRYSMKDSLQEKQVDSSLSDTSTSTLWKRFLSVTTRGHSQEQGPQIMAGDSSRFGTQQSSASHIRQQELMEQKRVGLWRGQLLLEDRTQGLTSRVEQEWRRGLPMELRGVLWSDRIGNHLHLTEEIYAMYKRYWYRQRLSFAYTFRDQNSTSSCPLIGREQTLRGVGVDLSRTFGSLQLFRVGSALRTKLQQCLEIFAIYRPDLGYVQGMSFIAGLLAVYIPNEYDLFRSLANLLVSHHFFAYFQMNQILLPSVCCEYLMCRKYSHLFDYCLKACCPKVAQHKRELQLPTDVFFFQWMQCGFLNVLPMGVGDESNLSCRSHL